MTQCWKCSSALTDKPRCESCNALNSLEGLSVHGVVRDDDEVTIYAVEDSPGHLIIDLHQKKGLLSQLPRPDKPNAMSSKAFTNIWKRTRGDHPLLQRTRTITHIDRRGCVEQRGRAGRIISLA